MRNMKIKSKVLVGLIISSMVLYTTAFGSENVQATSTTQGAATYQIDINSISAILSKLVDKGIITSSEKNLIQEEIIDSQGDIKKTMNKLAAKGIISSDQEKYIDEVLAPLNHIYTIRRLDGLSLMFVKLGEFGLVTPNGISAVEKALSNSTEDDKTTLDKLVAKGTITSKEEEYIEQVLVSSDQSDVRQNEEELQDLIFQLKVSKGDNNQSLLLYEIEKLSEEGIISSNKDTTISEAIVNAKGDIENALNALVAEGIITSSEKINIEIDFAKIYINDKTKLSEAFNKLVSLGIIDSDKQTTIEEAINNAKGDVEPVFDKLVSEGLITSDQKTVLKDIVDGILSTSASNDSNISVDYKVENSWGNNVKANVKVTNTSNEIIRNWALKVEFNGYINEIWNGSKVSHSGNTYLIKNTGWPRDITTGSSVEFGFIASYEGENQPIFTNASIASTERTVDKDYYNIDFTKNEEWDNGFNANLTIKDTIYDNIEDWTIDFDYKDIIESIPDAEIVSHEGNHYKIRYKAYNSVIKGGESLTLPFVGKPANGTKSTEVPKNYTLTKVSYC